MATYICSCRRSTDLMSDFFSRFYTIQRNISRMIFLVESIVDHRKVCLQYRLHTIRAVVFIFIVLFTLVLVFTYRIMFLYFVRGDLGFGSLLFSMCILTYVRQQSGEFKFRGNCNIYKSKNDSGSLCSFLIAMFFQICLNYRQ